jgi:hypothetical protein
MAWFNGLNVMTKLLLSFLGVSLISCAISGIGMSQMDQFAHRLDGTYRIDVTGSVAVQEASTCIMQIGRDVRQTVLEDNPTNQQALVAGVEKLVARYFECLKTAEETTASQDVKAQVRHAHDKLTAHLPAAKEVMQLALEGKTDAAMVKARALHAGCNEICALLDKINKLKRELSGQRLQEANMAYASAWRLLLGLTIGGVALSLVIGFCIARWFTRAIVEVNDISNSVAAASQQLAAASEQLSSGAQQSASSLEETASSLEEITATVRQNADNADQANKLANNSRETAEKGGAVVANAVKAMAEINQASRKIADIITTIDEIAFQTNLLALNAAVEAARAGEQGRGFAVVAGEVRNLAQRSATAAREIKGLIQDSVNKVESGSELVNKSGETLGDIVSSVKRVTDIVAEIAAASREQTVGIEQINKAVAQMDQVTQSNASQTEEMSGTAVTLSSQAEQLQTVVAQFNLKKQEVKASAHRPVAVRSVPAIASQLARKPQSRKSTTRPQSAKPPRELELVGAGASHDAFEEF